MERKERLLRLKKEGVLKGLFLYEDDLLVTKQIYLHRIMRSPLVFDYYRHLSGGVRTNTAISKRLAKMVEAGVLVLDSNRRPYSNYSYYFYKVGERGLEALIQLGYIDKETNVKNMTNIIRNTKLPTSHNIGLSHLANKSFIKCLEHPKVNTFEQMQGYSHPEFLESKNSIVPDWVFSNKDTIICLEFDTGTQRQHVISQKYKKYFKKCREKGAKYKKWIVLFSVADDSLEGTWAGNREKRVASIKSTCPPYTEWEKKDSDESEIHYYVVSAERTPTTIARLLSGESPLPVQLRVERLENWFVNMSFVASKKYELTLIDKETVLETRRGNKGIDSDCFFKWQRYTDNVHLRRDRGTSLVGVVCGDEGSVHTLHSIQAGLRRLRNIKESSVYATATLLVCYADAEQSIEDVYGINLDDDSFKVTDAETWSRSLEEKASIPEMLEVTTNFSKSWKEFSLL